MYVKFQNAVVFVEPQPPEQAQADKPISTDELTQPRQSKPAHNPPANSLRQRFTTLWSDRPFAVSQGHLVGVRKSGKIVEVVLVAS